MAFPGRELPQRAASKAWPEPSPTPAPLTTPRASNIACSPCTRYDLRVDSFQDPEALYARLEDYCRHEGPRHRTDNAVMYPLVHIYLVGTLAFDAGSLDQSRMEDMVRSHFQSLYVRINNNT